MRIDGERFRVVSSSWQAPSFGSSSSLSRPQWHSGATTDWGANEDALPANSRLVCDAYNSALRASFRRATTGTLYGMKSNQLTRGLKRRVMYVENKNGDIDGAAARIG